MKSAVIFCGMSGSGSSLYKQNGTMYVHVLLLRRNHQKPKYTTVVLSNALSILLDYIHCYTSCNGQIVTLSGVCCLYLWISANKKLTRRAKRPVGDKVTFHLNIVSCFCSCFYMKTNVLVLPKTA